MNIPECIFCKIISGELPSYKIYEDENFVAILDIFPNTKGMTLLLTKDHYDSYAANLDDKLYSDFFLAAKKVSKIIDERIGVNRTALVMEGMGINHAHIKLYPLHGIDKEFNAIVPEDNVYFEKYPGYVTTLLGKKASDEELKQIQNLFL